MSKFFITAILASVLAFNSAERCEARTSVPGAVKAILHLLPSDDDLAHLSRIAAEPGGIKSVGKILSDKKLPDHVQELAWIRIAVDQEKISGVDANKMFARLSGVPGFRATLRKVCGNNPSAAIGHLNELNIAQTAAKHGFKVRGIGQKFDDPGKKNLTDIDLVLEHYGKIFAIEAKEYSAVSLPLDRFRADMDTLVEFRQASGLDGDRTIPVFSVSQVIRPLDLRILKMEARKRNIQLLIGDPEEQILQILQLSRIM